MKKTQNFEFFSNFQDLRLKKVNKSSIKNFEFCTKNIESINKKECSDLIVLMEEYFKLLNRIYETNFYLKNILAKSLKIEKLNYFLFEAQKKKLELSKKKENIHSKIFDCRKTKERLLNERKNFKLLNGFTPANKIFEIEYFTNNAENACIYEESKNKLMHKEIISLKKELYKKLKKIKIKRQEINNYKAKILSQKMFNKSE